MQTSPFTGSLFDEGILDKLIEDHKGDMQTEANVRLANTIAEAIPVIAKGRGTKRKAPRSVPKPPPGMVAMGSPLTDPPSSSAVSAPQLTGRKFVKVGRGRGGRGRGGVQFKVEGKAPGNSQKNFQS